MNTFDLYLLLTGYILTVAVAAIAEFLRSRETSFLITVAVALLGVAAMAVFGTRLSADTSYFKILWFLIAARDLSSLVSFAMGVAVASVWVTRRTYQANNPPDDNRRWIEAILLAASIVFVVLTGQVFIWRDLHGITRYAVDCYAPEFAIEWVADLDYEPQRVAASDDGKIYVCYDYFKKYGAIGGAIVQLSEDAVSGEFRKKVVVESPFLVRPYGLAVRDGELFVSRSGFFPKTAMGNVAYESTGAVTQLKDVDGDGYFEYAHDVVSDLPGARAPDTMQQNNGIAFGSDGSLFVTSGVAADRSLDEHPWGGTILRVSPDFTQTTVYAQGFRNPWGIAVGADDEVFATDSDVNRNPGHEVNHIVEGGHYGHPFIVPNEAGVAAIGFRDPILVAERAADLRGIAYATSRFLPETYRNCLYVADFGQNHVLRLTLVRAGETYRVSGVSRFATVPSPVDITITPAGEFFVISRRAAKVYRIRLHKSTARENDE